jgi:hypothetical protein
MSLLLSAEDESIYRDAAAEAWRRSGGSLFHARRLLKKDPRIVGLDPATILMILQIAWKLWQLWKERKVTEPESVRRADEPCFGSQE